MFDNTESGLLTDDGEYITTTQTDAETQSAEALTTIIETEQEPETINKWALRDRLRSKVLWASVIAEIAQLIEIIIQWVQYGITPSSIEVFLLVVLAILETFGIVNDPTNREGF